MSIESTLVRTLLTHCVLHHHNARTTVELINEALSDLEWLDGDELQVAPIVSALSSFISDIKRHDIYGVTVEQVDALRKDVMKTYEEELAPFIVGKN